MAAARVLIVDDEPGVLKLVNDALSGRGYDTETTPSPGRALEIVQAGPHVDLLVSDVVMPEMCGPELARKVACMSPSTAVVLMSAYVSTADLPPHAAFISKPFSLKDLFAIVERALASSRQLRNDLSRACEASAELSARAEELGGEIDELGRVVYGNLRRVRQKRG